MTDIIANAVVDLGRLAVIAFGIHALRGCFTAWLQAGQPGRASAEARIVDIARAENVDLFAVAQAMREEGRTV